MATMTVKFAGDNYGEHGNFESGHFVTNLPPERFPIETASENQKWRIKRNFEAGIPWDGTLLGYRLENGRYVVVPKEAELVRRIYNEYLSGKGYPSIAKMLNDEGVPSRFGGKWNQSSISRILSNYTYAGNLLLQKTFRENHITKKRITNMGELPKYHAEDSHEAIIDMKTF